MEFLVSADGRAYFLEMNTRLQVEHPVTEAVFGLDLVALQLTVAEGRPLDAEPPRPHGHAVEARLYAEDPAAAWQPQTGTLHRLALPDGVRLDSGVTDGDTIGVHYDPMLAKVLAWAPSRDEAVRKLAGALERARIHGPVTNRELLVRSLRHPEFTDPGALDTGFYDRNLPALTAAPADGAGVFALAAALADAHGRSRFGGFRNVPSGPQVKTYACAGAEYAIRYRLCLLMCIRDRDGLSAEGFPGVRLLALGPDQVVLEVDGLRRQFAVARYGDRVHVDAPPTPGGGGTAPASHAFTALPRFPDPTARTEPGSLLAPMPGTVARIAEGLSEGARVAAGQPLLWLEAMKMEHKITAPAAGTLTALPVGPGQQVEVGALLAVVAETAAAGETVAGETVADAG